MGIRVQRSWSGHLRQGLLPAIETELRNTGMTEGEQFILDVLDREQVNFQGDLAKSVTTDVERSGRDIQMRVGPDAEHAKYVFHGTAPHWAPIAPLKQWVDRKLGGGPPNPWQVQWSIAQTGTDPVDFLTGPAKKLEQIIPRRIEETAQDHLS